MAQITLRKLLKKNKPLHGALAGLLDASEPAVAVHDPDGALLFGQSPPDNTFRRAVEQSGQILGWVAGNRAQTDPIAQLLAALLAQESEKRALAGEILDKYRELNLLYTLSDRLLVEPEPQAIAHLALSEAGRLIHFSAGWVLLSDGDQPVVLSHVGQALHFRNEIEGNDDLLAQVLTRREAEIRNDVPAHSYFEDGVFDRCALLCAPLKTEQRVLGAVLLAGENPISYEARDLKLLNTMALQVAPALEMARLYQVAVEKGRMERELQLAYQVQAGLIPRQTPQAAGWQFAGTWRPARELSGDYYDFVEEGDGQIGLVIGDVADKGMPSALFMVHTRAAVRTAIRSRQPPAKALFEANRLVQPESHKGNFVTLIYARLDTATGRLTFANAGHNPGLIYSAAEDRFRELQRTGLPLGILDEAPYEQGQEALASGDILVLYTDGLTEAVDDAMEEFGLRRLKETIHSHAQGTAQALIAAIEQALDAFVGDAPPFDDVTLLVAKMED